MKIDRILELPAALDRTRRSSAVARLYVRDDGMELVAALYGGKTDVDHLLGATRILFVPKNALTETQMEDVLIKKYGEPLAPHNWTWGTPPSSIPAPRLTALRSCPGATVRSSRANRL